MSLQDGSFPLADGPLRPRPYEPVVRACGDDGCGMILHRDVAAIQVPGGFLVQIYEYVQEPCPGPVACGPGPGHYTTVFLPVQTTDEIVRALFEEAPE